MSSLPGALRNQFLYLFPAKAFMKPCTESSASHHIATVADRHSEINSVQSEILPLLHRTLYKSILSHIQMGVNPHGGSDAGMTCGFGEGCQIEVRVIFVLDIIVDYIGMAKPVDGNIVGQAVGISSPGNGSLSVQGPISPILLRIFTRDPTSVVQGSGCRDLTLPWGNVCVTECAIIGTPPFCLGQCGKPLWLFSGFFLPAQS